MSDPSSPTLNPPVGPTDHVLGPLDAKTIIVEYGDYECPHCQHVHENMKLLREYIGDEVCYVYRHLPITSAHPHAILAAEAAEAAAAQGKFWEMHNRLFEHGPISEDRVLSDAAEIGLDMERFRFDLAEHTYANLVQEDRQSGLKSGANGTPTFFINGIRYDGAWDFESMLELIRKPIGVRVQLLTQRFTRLAASGGIVLLLGTILALVWANSGFASKYFELWNTDLSLHLGNLHLAKHLLHWVNDGLMAVFFFVVGLEIKRELTTGELGSPKRAALPIAAALGGMVAPAIIYGVFNIGGEGMSGWGVPMATDIAFTLGILIVLGNRIPLSLKVFFTALAIADDLGAILVIAFFYTANIQWIALLVGLLFFVALIALNRARVYQSLPYVILGLGLWLAFLKSGIHPTIAGVLLALTIPTRSPVNMRTLLAQVVTLLHSFDLPVEWRETYDIRRQATTRTLETITSRMVSPAEKLEHALNPWSTFLILPIFALANAGLALNGDAFGKLGDPVSLGILFGLVIGKPLGISLFSWLAVRLKLADLPIGVHWPDFIGASFLAGIGFTMSLFISEAAFTNPATLDTAKLAIFIASILAAILGFSLLLIFSVPSRGKTPR